MTPRELITDFLLARIAEQPVAQRVLLYRSLAAESDDRLVRDCCGEMANRLDEIERTGKQLRLDLQRRAEG